VQLHEQPVRIVRRHVDQFLRIEHAVPDRPRNRPQRPDLAHRKPDALQLRRARAQHAGGIERIDRRRQASPDRRRARRRELLRDDDRGKPAKAAGPPAQRQRAGERMRGREPTVSRDQVRGRSLKIRFGVNEVGHGRQSIYNARCMQPSVSR